MSHDPKIKHITQQVLNDVYLQEINKDVINKLRPK